ncbi:MAG: alpha/beta fold hydrolase [Candidatus Sulfotelmatobacter sp.]
MIQGSAVEFLLPIWQRVLQRPSIDVNENFFDLGGNPSLADTIFAEIAEERGRDLTPLLIYRAPTISTLAALLEQPDPPSVPPLLSLKAGPDSPPIYIAHGIGGTVFGFFDLVNKIETSHSIYGMQARGIDGVNKPFTTIEAMAQFHLDAIKELQPVGPYLLIGYSLGGLVALEIAQRLLAGGEKVALLALVDSYPHKNHLPAPQRRRLSLRVTKRRVGLLMQSVLGKTRTRNVSGQEKNPVGGTRHFAPPTDGVPQWMEDAADVAWERYHPQFYPGAIKFVKAEINTYFPDDPVAVWSHLAAKFEVETAPGNHVGMIAAHFESLAKILGRYLREAHASAR